MPLPKFEKDYVNIVHFPKNLLPMTRFPYKMKQPKKRKKIVISKEEEVIPMKLYAGPELLRHNDQIYCLRLDKEYQSLLECVIGEDLTIVYNWKYILKDSIIQDINVKGPASQLYPISAAMEKSSSEHVLVIYDKNIAANYLFFCINPLHEYRLINNEFSQKIGWMRHCYYNNLRPLMHYKSKSVKRVSKRIGTDIKFVPRSRIMVAFIIDRREKMARKVVLTSVEASELQDGLVNYIPRRKDKERHGSQIIQALQYRDICSQLTPKTYGKYTQTTHARQLNKAIQKNLSAVEEELYDQVSPQKVLNISEFCVKFLSSGVQEYSRLDIHHDIVDEYKGKYSSTGHTLKQRFFRRKMSSIQAGPMLDKWEFLRLKFKLVPEYRDFNSISCLAWHPTYVDLLAIAYFGNVQVNTDYPEEHIEITDVRDKTTIPEYVIVIWKISKEMLPKRIIVTNCEVQVLQFNVDFPSFLLGANSCGQILLWDLNICFIPESGFLKFPHTNEQGNSVPWNQNTPKISDIIIESSEVLSHTEKINALQWVPRTSIMYAKGVADTNEKGKIGKIVTASEDGTIGFWSIPSKYQAIKEIKKKYLHLPSFCPEIPGFMHDDRQTKPEIKHVVAQMNNEPVPVTAISVSDISQWVMSQKVRTNYFSYKSMCKGAEEKQCPEMNLSITVALANGQILTVDPSHQDHSKNRGKQTKSAAKVQYWQAHKVSQIQSKAYAHESMVECLRRCPYADDMLLSVSVCSFCIWKEQSKLRRGKKKKKHVSQVWQFQEEQSEEAHFSGRKVNICPVYWKRILLQNFQYVNGNWSSGQTGQIYLLTSDGCIEIWDLENEDANCALSTKVGVDVVNRVIPLIFSTRTDEVAYIEDELFYFCKVPKICKYENDSDPKYFQKLGNHEIWRRAKYYTFCQQYEQDNEESIWQQASVFEGFCRARRKSRLTRAFDVSRFVKAKERKSSAYDSVKWSGNFPAKWWVDEKKWSVTYYLKKRNMPMLWEIERDRNILLSYIKKFEAHTIPKTELMKSLGFILDWEIYHIYNEYFQLFWDLRYEETHEYAKCFVEDDGENMDIANELEVLQQNEIRARETRKDLYELGYIFPQHYEVRKLQDVFRTKQKKHIGKKGSDLTSVCKTVFTEHIKCMLKKDTIHQHPEFCDKAYTSQSPPPMSQTWDLLERYDFILGV